MTKNMKFERTTLRNVRGRSCWASNKGWARMRRASLFTPAILPQRLSQIHGYHSIPSSQLDTGQRIEGATLKVGLSEIACYEDFTLTSVTAHGKRAWMWLTSESCIRTSKDDVPLSSTPENWPSELPSLSGSYRECEPRAVPTV